MIRNRLVLIVAVGAVLIAGCSDKEEHAVESRWRMSDLPATDLALDEAALFVSIDEFEKLLRAPLAHYEQSYPVRGFSQEVSYETASVVEGTPRRLTLSEKVLYGRDDQGSFHLSFRNDRNEGWDFVWHEGFLYKKLLGGEYVRTSSAGEHTFYRETLFRILPDIATLLRDHAEMKVSQSGQVRRVTIHFSDKKVPRQPLPPRRYLQNAYGVEEMNNDRTIEKLAGKNLGKITGTLNAEVAAGPVLRRLVLDVSFTVLDEEVSFVIRGERVLSDKPLLETAAPPFVPEYHRRSFDAAKNIMEKESPREKK